MPADNFGNYDPGATIKSGSTIYVVSSGGGGLHGTGDPTDNTVAAGTTYVDDSSGNFWAKSDSGWVKLIG